MPPDSMQPVRFLKFLILLLICMGVRCSSMVGAFSHGVMCRRIDPISHSSQCFMTDVTKAVVCAKVSVGWCI